MGVLTHLDFFKENKQLRKTKKRIKRRFGVEVNPESKLFFIGGLKQDGYYPKMDIMNLARYISIIRHNPVSWKQNHPFILADRFEIATDGVLKDEDDCNISFYGYVRGCSYRSNQRMHLVGLGDFDIKTMTVIDDPCPLAGASIDANAAESEEEEGEGPAGQGAESSDWRSGKTKAKKHRTLKSNERTIYAPMTNLGALSHDKEGSYVNIPDRFVVFTRESQRLKTEDEPVNPLVKMFKSEQSDEGGQEQDADEKREMLEEGVQMVRNLQDMADGIDARLRDEEDAFLLDGVKMEAESDQMGGKSGKSMKDYINKNALKEIEEIYEQNKIEDLKTEFGLPTHTVATDLADLIYKSADSTQLVHFDSTRFSTSDFHPIEYYHSLLKEQFLTGRQLGG